MYRILCLAILSGLLLQSCGEKKPVVQPPTPVNLMTISTQKVVYYERYPGTTTALSQVNLMPQVQGYITGIFFKEGTHVKKGQKLYEIDRRLYDANYQAAQANLRVAEGNLKQAQQDADRYTYLNENKAVAKQLYDHAMITLQNSKNQVQAAAESLKTSRTNLTYSIITAPFDGTIGFSQVKLGNLVNVGQTVLNTISTDDPMAVDFLINEKQLNYFERLEAGKGRNIDSLFTLILPDKSYFQYQGKISVIDRAVDPQTGSIKVRLVFPNTGYPLRAGMSCVVRVRNLDSQPQVLIPNKAVVEQMGEFFVFVAKDTTINANGSDSTAKNKEEHVKSGLLAFQRKVHLGEVVGPNVIVKDGLEEGEKIVVDGVQSLHDTSPITVGKGPKAGGKGQSGSGTHDAGNQKQQ